MALWEFEDVYELRHRYFIEAATEVEAFRLALDVTLTDRGRSTDHCFSELEHQHGVCLGEVRP